MIALFTRLPMFGFIVLAFLFLIAILAIAVYFAFGSGKDGRTRLDSFGGCAVGCALLFLGALGALAVLVVSAVHLKGEAIRRGPVKSIEIQTPDDHDDNGDATPKPAPPAAGETHETETPPKQGELERVTPTPKNGVLRIELRGGADAGPVLKWLRDNSESELEISVRETQDKDGKRTVIEVELPKEAREQLRELRDELQKDSPDLRIPNGIKIELRGVDDD